jgi:hypothetical protein
MTMKVRSVVLLCRKRKSKLCWMVHMVDVHWILDDTRLYYYLLVVPGQHLLLECSTISWGGASDWDGQTVREPEGSSSPGASNHSVSRQVAIQRSISWVHLILLKWTRSSWLVCPSSYGDCAHGCVFRPLVDPPGPAHICLRHLSL